MIFLEKKWTKEHFYIIIITTTIYVFAGSMEILHYFKIPLF